MWFFIISGIILGIMVVGCCLSAVIRSTSSKTNSKERMENPSIIPVANKDCIKAEIRLNVNSRNNSIYIASSWKF